MANPALESQMRTEKLEALIKPMRERYFKQNESAVVFAEQVYEQASLAYTNAEYEKASHYFKLCTMRAPLVYKYWFALGASLQLLRDYVAANQAYSVALAIDAGAPEPCFHMLECFLEQKNTREARIAFSETQRRLAKNASPTLAARLELLRAKL